MHAQSQNQSLPSDDVSAPAPSSETPPDSKQHEEKAKRTKHTRVHKREKELCGLVTPIFLPLLDAEPSQAAKKKEKKRRHKEIKAATTGDSPPSSEHGSPSRDADKEKETRSSRSKTSAKMGQGEAVKAEASGMQSQAPAPAKKTKRSALKKSSLRSGEKSRRKRVSLVIDDQIVLPTQDIPEPPLASPSETTASSASNSTTSLDEIIDPRLLHRHDTPMHIHQDPVHHSLPLPMPLPSTSPTKHTGHTLPESYASNSPASPSRSPRSSSAYIPPQTSTHTFLDPSPPNVDLSIPQYASAAPIYASEPELAEAAEESFSTYVGGIDGSGVDDLDQTGSLGYPSSLGASYLESYMQSRPLSVRMAAAEKAGLDEDEKALLVKGKGREEDLDVDVGRIDDVEDEEMEVIGSMEGI